MASARLRSQRARGLDEFLGAQRAGDREDEPRVPGPPQRRDRQHRVDETRRQHRGDRERHHQRRDGERDIGQAHDDDLGPAAEIAGDEPESRAERDRGAKDDRGQQERDAIAEQHPGENVAPDIVGAEPVSGGRRQVTGAEIDHRANMVRIGRDQRREERRGEDDDHDRRTDHRRRIAAETAPVLVGGRDPGRGFPRHGGAHARSPRMRTLGSTTPTRTSIVRLTRTKNRPEIITTPITAFKSFCRMLRTP
jgi:hypothetical protein